MGKLYSGFYSNQSRRLSSPLALEQYRHQLLLHPGALFHKRGALFQLVWDMKLGPEVGPIGVWLLELDYLDGAVKNPKRPFAAIVGGSKVSSKIRVIESLLEKCDILLLGGVMIFTFYKAQGISTGSSLVEEDKIELATSLLEKAKAKGVSLLLPTDVVVDDKFSPDANTQTVPETGIPDGWMGLDIGPDSIKTFSDALETTKTVIWNGPMGVFEFDKFAVGTEVIAKKLADLSGKGVTTIEEEVENVYERLQALEANREFLKQSISSLKKGDKGMDLLREILQYLRDLRSVELCTRNMSDASLS